MTDESDEVRRTVTILFADLAESTSVAERVDAESFRALLTRYYALSREAIAFHGGTVEKYAGDAVMAVFGYPTAHEDDALRALRAAVQIRSRVRDLPDAAVHIGVNTGEVVVGAAQAGIVATGDAVNVAARLEEAAETGEILLGGSTQKLVRDAANVERVGALAVKGRREPVEAFRFVALVQEPARDRVESRLVGRVTELAVLADAFSRAARDRRPSVITVVGPPGVGKSRVVREFARTHAGQAAILRGRCLPYGEGITFWPIKELVAQAAGLAGDEPSETGLAKLRSLLGPGEEHDAVAARVAEVVGLADGKSGLPERFWAVRVLLETLARRRPLIVVFDDVQWAEPTMSDLVAHIAHAHDAQLVVVCLAREELLDAPPPWLGPTVLRLAPLAPAETEELVANLAAGAPDELCAHVARVAEGNPLFAEELVRVLVDEGVLVGREGTWRLVRGLEDVRVPPTIEALLTARLDLLGATERRVLGAAAVEGRRFHKGALGVLAELDATRLDEALHGLVTKQLVREDDPDFDGEEAFRFHHLLVRDVAYAAARKDVRAELHERYASWLDEKAGARAAEYDEIVGYHLEASYRYGVQLGTPSASIAAKAAARIAPAGLRAHARGDMPAAASLLTRAVGLLAEDGPERAALESKLEEALLEQRTNMPGRFAGQSLRCFWSWRWGHAWVAAEHHGLRVLRCSRCGKERRRPRTERPIYEAEAMMVERTGYWGGGGGG